MDSWLLMMLAFVAVISPAIFQALSGSGREAPALSGAGYAAPALARRLLMTDSKPSLAPAPAPAHSPKNPVCTSCCPQKTPKLFSKINKVFGWVLAIYLSLGIVYFIHCTCLSFKDLPKLPMVRLYPKLKEADIERLQNVAASENRDRPTEEQLREAKRFRTQLDVHMDKHNTGALVWMTGGEAATAKQRFKAAYEYSTSWMIPIGKPFLACYLALKFSWPAFESLGAPAWAGNWLF